MNIPTRLQIERLAAQSGGPFVSIYMPTHRCGPDTAQDPIRLKNLIRDASQQLQALGSDDALIDHLMSPVTALIGDYEFWQHQMDGLMIFRGIELLESYRVDIALPELAVAGERPHLKPMLAFLSGDAQFYVLALSQNHPRLFLGTRQKLEEIEVENMPANFDETLPEADGPAALQSHAGSSGHSGGRSMVYHGQSAGDETSKERLHLFCRRIDQAIHPLLPVPPRPLILASVDYLAPIYRKANSYPGLQSDSASGNPDLLPPAELLAATLPIAQRTFDQARAKAADRYLELWHTQRASNDLAGVVPAAVRGRVDTLFTAVGRQIWGAYNSTSGEVTIAENPSPDNEDLLNLAAIHTYLNGGAVFAVPPADVPGGGPLAAVYRY